MSSLYPGGSDGKASAYNPGNLGSTPGSEDLLEKETATPPVFLLGKSHGQRSLVGYSPQGRKESDTTKQLHSLTCIVWITDLLSDMSF